MGKIILVTGATTGIGRSIASVLVSHGHIVYGSGRSANTGETKEGVLMLRMDITDENSVNDGIRLILKEQQRIDAVVNNAGTGFNGPAENISNTEAISNFNLNVLGAWNVCRAVIPHMRRQGRGNIINISSFAGLMGLPFRALYCTTKHALEGLMESMSLELVNSGIWVSIIEPAEFKTDIVQNRGSANFIDPIYDRDFSRIVEQINSGVEAAPEPTVVGHCVHRILNSKSPKLRYKLAPFGTKMSIFLKRILPDRVFEKMMLKHFGLVKK